MNQNGFIFLAMYVILVISTAMLTLTQGFDGFCKTPNEVYETTDLNMLGCVLLWIFSIVINPFGYVLYFIYFLFHVGRKYKEEDESD